MDMHEVKGLVTYLHDELHMRGGHGKLLSVVGWLENQKKHGAVDLDKFYDLPGYQLAASLPAASWSAGWNQVFDSIGGPYAIGRGLVAEFGRVAALHNASQRASAAGKLRNRITPFYNKIRPMHDGLTLVKGEGSGPSSIPSLTFAFHHDIEVVNIDAIHERMQLVRDLTTVLAEIVGESVTHEVLYLGRGSVWITVAAKLGVVTLVASTVKSLADAVKSVVDAVQAVRGVRDSPAGKNEEVMHKLEVTIKCEREKMLETVTAEVKSNYPSADPEVVHAMVSATSDLLMRGDRVFPHAPKQPEGPVDLEDEVIFVFDENKSELEEVDTEGPEHHMARVSPSSKK